MSCFHCTSALLLLHALLIFCCSSCITASSPSSCGCWSLPTSFLIDGSTRNLTLFNQSSFPLYPNQPFSASFDFTSDLITHEDSDSATPSLAFILSQSLPPPLLPLPLPLPLPQNDPSIQSMELTVNQSETCNFRKLDVCDSSTPEELQIHNCSTHSRSYQPYDSHPTHFKDAVSLRYEGDAGVVHVQAVSYRDALINQNFTFNSITPDGPHDETITLFVGYITASGEEANIFTIAVSPPSGEEANTTALSSPNFPPSSEIHSKHNKVVLWVVVGASMMVLLIGSLILVLLYFIKHRTHPSLDVTTSRPPAAATCKAPPSKISRAPFPHHRLESPATPIMLGLPPSPPYTNDFQMSGTASWLKPPNTR